MSPVPPMTTTFIVLSSPVVVDVERFNATHGFACAAEYRSPVVLLRRPFGESLGAPFSRGRSTSFEVAAGLPRTGNSRIPQGGDVLTPRGLVALPLSLTRREPRMEQHTQDARVVERAMRLLSLT